MTGTTHVASSFCVRGIKVGAELNDGAVSPG